MEGNVIWVAYSHLKVGDNHANPELTNPCVTNRGKPPTWPTVNPSCAILRLKIPKNMNRTVSLLGCYGMFTNVHPEPSLDLSPALRVWRRLGTSVLQYPCMGPSTKMRQVSPHSHAYCNDPHIQGISGPLDLLSVSNSRRTACLRP